MPHFIRFRRRGSREPFAYLTPRSSSPHRRLAQPFEAGAAEEALARLRAENPGHEFRLERAPGPDRQP